LRLSEANDYVKKQALTQLWPISTKTIARRDKFARMCLPHEVTAFDEILRSPLFDKGFIAI